MSGKLLLHRLLATVVAALLLAFTNAFAATTHYTITGTGSGSLNGTSFNDMSFSFDLIGDPALASTIDPLVSATISISTLGTATFSIPTRLGFNTGNSAVYFSRGDASHLDLFDFFVQAGSLVNGLVGPFSVAGTDVFALGQFVGVGTSLGALTFTSSSDVVFTAAVPEPETYAMLMAGLGLLGVVARRKKQMAS